MVSLSSVWIVALLSSARFARNPVGMLLMRHAILDALLDAAITWILAAVVCGAAFTTTGIAIEAGREVLGLLVVVVSTSVNLTSTRFARHRGCCVEVSRRVRQELIYQVLARCDSDEDEVNGTHQVCSLLVKLKASAS